MKKVIQKVAACVLLAAIVLVSTGAKGCGKNNDPTLVAAYKASVRLSTYATSAATSTLKAYRDGVISLETKDQIFAKLEIMAKAGRTFHNSIVALQEKFPDGNVSASEILSLEILFDSTIYSVFLDVLELVNALPPDKRAVIELAIETLKAAIGTIRRAFSRAQAISATMEGVYSA